MMPGYSTDLQISMSTPESLRGLIVMIICVSEGNNSIFTFCQHKNTLTILALSTVIKNCPLILVFKVPSNISSSSNRISNKISVSSKLRLIFIYFRFLSNFSIKFLFNFLTCTTMSVKQNQFSYFNIFLISEWPEFEFHFGMEAKSRDSSRQES